LIPFFKCFISVKKLVLVRFQCEIILDEVKFVDFECEEWRKKFLS